MPVSLSGSERYESYVENGHTCMIPHIASTVGSMQK